MKPILLTILFVAAQMAMAIEFHVAPTGSDTNPGTKDKPFATLERARDAARQAKGSTVFVRGGTYQLDKTLVLTSADSGLTIRAVEDEKPVLSGGRQISGWKKFKDNIWVADVPKGWCFHYLYVDGQPLPRAKLHNTHWPNGQSISLTALRPRTGSRSRSRTNPFLKTFPPTAMSKWSAS